MTAIEELLCPGLGAERQLCDGARHAEQRYRALLDRASDTITLLTPEGVVLEANARWRELAGIDPEQLVGKHIRELTRADIADGNSASFRRAVERGGARSRPVPVLRADGSTIYLEFSTALVDVDGRPTVLAIGREVTEQVEAEARLAHAEERYRTLIERMPDVLFTAKVSQGLVFVTGNLRTVCGVEPHEACAFGAEWWQARVHPEDAAVLGGAYRAFAEGTGPLDVEVCWRRGGEWIWIRCRGIAAYDRDGERYIDGVLSDLTERKHLEESLRVAQKMEAIARLTGGIAHDFNNILGAILANAHFLIEDLPAADPRRAEAEDIRAAAERAASLTRQLLAFSRRQVLEARMVDIDATVTALEKMLRRLIGEDIELTVELGVLCGAVRVDVGQLEQVIMNLVVNARDAMPGGGRLAITTSCIELTVEGAAPFALSPGRYARLAVQDTGCGIDEPILARIFEPFFTTKEPGRGTGLGLATSYGIMRQSGGAIGVRSEVGRGTTFEILLPVHDALPEAHNRSAGTGAAASPAHETILLIEDDASLREAIRRMLSDSGYRVLVATDGAAALGATATHRGRIDLVLSDVVMPGASGPSVVERVRERFPGAKIVLMSGYTTHPMLTDTASQPRFDFLQKPFSPASLLRKVREALDA